MTPRRPPSSSAGSNPPHVQQRYLADLTAAETGLEDAVARGGAGHGATAADLRTLATDIRLYDGEVQTARRRQPDRPAARCRLPA